MDSLFAVFPTDPGYSKDHLKHVKDKMYYRDLTTHDGPIRHTEEGTMKVSIRQYAVVSH